MSRKIVVYFSASGVTAKVAENLSEAIGADLSEIQPKVPYTKSDLDWRNNESRSSIEMKNQSLRPEIASVLSNIDEYDTIFVGFPIWWYVAPTIVNTYLESHNLAGKPIVTFATSGGSDMGETHAKLLPSCTGATLIEGKVFHPSVSKSELAAWSENLGI